MKRTKRNLQAFRLTEARMLNLSEIGSPLGFFMNKFMKPSGGDTSGTSRRNILGSRIVVSRARQALLLILLALCRIAARKHHNMVFSLAHADGQKH